MVPLLVIAVRRNTIILALIYASFSGAKCVSIYSRIFSVSFSSRATVLSIGVRGKGAFLACSCAYISATRCIAKSSFSSTITTTITTTLRALIVRLTVLLLVLLLTIYIRSKAEGYSF